MDMRTILTPLHIITKLRLVNFWLYFAKVIRGLMVQPMDYDDADVDNDLDKILQNIKEDQQNSMDIPDSPKEHDHPHHPHVPNMGHVAMETGHGDHRVS